MYSNYDYVGHAPYYHWKELAKERPDAKFILPIRPFDSWIKSARKKLRRKRADPRRVFLVREKLFGAGMPTVGQLENGYHKHINWVLNFFHGTDRLLVLNPWIMSDVVLWNKLAEFVEADAELPIREPGTSILRGFPRSSSPVRVYKPKRGYANE